jgi:DNA-binding MarR family transcriptional regulator
MKSASDSFAWPGHIIRRLQQTAVLAFHRNTVEFRLTPTQFVTLLAIETTPGVDQVRLSQTTMIDRSMTARIVDTLARRGLIRKQPGKTDKRANALFIAQKGARLLAAVLPRVKKSQQEILNPLTVAERAEFIRMARAILAANEEEEAEAAAGEEKPARTAAKRSVRKS